MDLQPLRAGLCLLLLSFACCLLPSAPAAGLYQDGAGARAKAMGGGAWDHSAMVRAIERLAGEGES